MNFGKYQVLIDYIKSGLKDTEYLHSIRVLNYALQILNTEKKADAEVVIAAAILHDVGRGKRSGKLPEGTPPHAETGSKKAYSFLIKNANENTVTEYLLKTDCQWCMLPKDFAKWQLVQ